MLSIATTTLIGCSKEENQNLVEVSTKEQKIKYDKLLDFFAWSIQVQKDNIKFDSKTNEFYIPKTVVREKLERIEEEYNVANLYRDNFENK